MALQTDPTLTGFEAYATVAECDATDILRGTDAGWTALTEAQKEVQIRLASEYIDSKFKFIGEVSAEGQDMKWPRTGTTFEDTEIPDILKRATYVLAKDSISTALYTNVVGSVTGGEIKSNAEKLGSLSTKVEYFQGTTASTQNVFEGVKLVLKPILQTKQIGR